MYFLLALMMHFDLRASDAPKTPSAPATASAAENKPVIPGWVKLQTDIQAMQGKILAAESNLNKLLLQKKTVVEGSAEAKLVVDELVKTHRSYKQLVEEYRRMESILKFRYPERGVTSHQQFKQVDNLAELEHEVGVDSEITRTWSLLHSQYQVEALRSPASLQEQEIQERQRQRSVLDSPPPQL
ncbi:MAG: hypothetical protein WCH11_03725 [Bdellovibrio sp.]